MAPVHEEEAVDITALLKSILDNYPAGSATLREILQNSDDAGSRIQRFVLDKRSFPSDSLVDPVYKVCQGPAIISVNDTHFKEKDWESVKKIHASSKSKDAGSTGKYGLGFRSCYHITDTPHVLSGNKLLVLDPHRRSPLCPGGFSISISDNSDWTKYTNHFSTFGHVFPDKQKLFDGTAIRYPLRSPEHALDSRIKKSPTTPALARQLFLDFIEKELAEVMLFLKHVVKIELWEVTENGTRAGASLLMGRAWIQDPRQASEGRSELWDRNTLHGSGYARLTIHVEVPGRVVDARDWLLASHAMEPDAAAQRLAQGSSKTKKTNQEKEKAKQQAKQEMADDKLISSVALALPLPKQAGVVSRTSGRLFTLLPLPIFTSFPIHINATFALSTSRQNLKNMEDATAGSREDRLIRWNHLIFKELVPRAWTQLLVRLVTEHPSVNPFDFWAVVTGSAEGDRAYWHPIPERLLELAGPKPVWPVLSGRERRVLKHTALADVLVFADEDDVLVTALCSSSLPIVLPPPEVTLLIKASSKYSRLLATPALVHNSLLKTLQALPLLKPDETGLILGHLASAKNINFLYDLPIIPNIAGGYSTVKWGRTIYTLVEEMEAKLLDSTNNSYLAAWKLPQEIKALFEKNRNQFHDVGPEVILQDLRGRYSRSSGSLSESATAQEIGQLVDFWNWACAGWNGSEGLFGDAKLVGELQTLYILPLASKTGYRLGRASDLAIDISELDEVLRSIFTTLDLPILHEDVRVSGLARTKFVVPPSDIPWILEALQSRLFTPSDLDQEQRRHLHHHFSQFLPSQTRSRSTSRTLSHLQRNCLRLLPIFPILPPGKRTSDIFFEALPASCTFVDQSVHIIPIVQGHSFIDFPQNYALATAMGHRGEGETVVLEKVLDQTQWPRQRFIPDLSDLLIERIMHRLNDLSPTARACVASLPIIQVGPHQTVRKSPSEVVDPKSKIAILYDPEDAVLPAGPFVEESPGSFIQQLRSAGMLVTQLSEARIYDRLTRLADVVNPLKSRGEKASELLRLLDEHAMNSPLSSFIIDTLRKHAWIPVGEDFYRPSECWDDRPEDTKLCGLVLPIIKLTVKTQRLRKALGWDQVPCKTLHKQFLAVLGHRSIAPPSSASADAGDIIPLLQALGSRLVSTECSVKHLQDMVVAIGDSIWVPVSFKECKDVQHVMLEPVNLGSRFQRVNPALASDPHIAAVLELMGVPKRPTVQALCADLQALSMDIENPAIDGDTKESLLKSSLLVIEELCQQPDWTLEIAAEEASQILLPTEERTMKPLARIVYNDIPYASSYPSANSFFAHPAISFELANTLNLRRLSDDPQFTKDETDIDNFVAAEGPADQVHDVLTEYGIDYTSNEWVANASATDASEVKILVDEALFDGKRVVGPGFTDFQSCPALVVYYDSILSDEHFQGLGNMGRGEMHDAPDASDRLGLGALSFYHFGERLMVISAGSVLLLDPSQKYLPRLASGARRSGMKMSIEACRTRFPDQLKPLEGMFGFTSVTSYYEGSLFHVPLRTVRQARESKLSRNSLSAAGLSEVVRKFFDNASQSLLFTKLRAIAAYHRISDRSRSELWSAICTRELVETLGEFEGAMELSLTLNTGDATRAEKWLVCTAMSNIEEFPEAIQPAFRARQLFQPDFAVAFRMLPQVLPSSSRLFTNLPVPISISLPVHIYGSFIPSNDRRAVRFDAVDRPGHHPLDACSNTYILQSRIPQLYLRTVAIAIARYEVQHDIHNHLWPIEAPADMVSRTIMDAVFQQFPSTPHRVLRTVLGQPIAPPNALIHVDSSPPAVARVLSSLQPARYVVHQPCPSGMLKRSGLHIDDAAELADVLRSSGPEKIKKLFREPPVANQPDPDESGVYLPPRDIDILLQYLLKGNQVIHGLPLLLLGDGGLIPFERQTATASRVFIASGRISEAVGELFGRSKVLSSIISKVTVGLLVKDPDLNVEILTVTGLRKLFEFSEENVVPINPEAPKPIKPTAVVWYDHVLSFLAASYHDGSDLTLKRFSDLPLIPTASGDSVLSLDLASREEVWWSSNLFPDEPFHPILQQIGVLVVDANTRVQRPAGRPYNLAKVLQVLDRYPDLKTLQQNVPPDHWANFVHWLRPQLIVRNISILGPQERQTVLALPLFLAKQGQSSPEFSPAEAVSMLPESAAPFSVARYLPQDRLFAQFELELRHIYLTFGMKERIISNQDLPGLLQLPTTISELEQADYWHVLEAVIKSGIGSYPAPLIPDGNWKLQVPSSLYDHRVPLFEQCFQNRPYTFIHPSFRPLADGLLRIGIIGSGNLRASDIEACAKVVDEESRNGLDTWEKAMTLWAYLSNSVVLQSISLNSMQHLRFVPSDPSHHPSDPVLSRFARQLPRVVSPTEGCSPSHAPILWTQRVAFHTPPSSFMKVVHPALGEPTAPEVVQHLVILATRVAPEHPRNDMLLADLKQTYMWLLQNVETAGSLLKRVQDRPIWLNVNGDPQDGQWVWRSANELIYDIRFDLEGGVYNVRTFLEPLKALLIASGVREHVWPELPPAPIGEHVEPDPPLLQALNRFRQNGVLLDIGFEVQETGEVVKAHRVMLAVAVPYFGDMFGGHTPENTHSEGMEESDVALYPLPRGIQVFAIRSVIDFVYTKFFVPPPLETADQVDSAREDLLQLLELSHLWGIERLKEQAEAKIVSMKLVLPGAYDSIQERAERCGAERLVQVCEESRTRNAWAHADSNAL